MRIYFEMDRGDTMADAMWPYPLAWGGEETVAADVLVLGGGVAGCMAAIAAAQAGRSVALVEKGATIRSGSGGSGCDHWESAATNPCCAVSPEELAGAMLRDKHGFNNGISHYIECREGYDRLLDIERMGGKVRDTEGEFAGAAFRDDRTGLMFAYDYGSRHTLRIWGTTFKPAMRRELARLGVKVFDRVMATSLLSEKGEPGARCVGAAGMHTRTGGFYVFRAKAVVMCTSRPARVWLFSASLPGLCEFRPPQCVGDGHAMGWRAGAAFTMMEKSVRAEFSAAGRSFPPYGAGNNHNTWYPASLVDAEGREVPWRDRDGNPVDTVAGRFRPAPGQPYFLMGGGIDDPIYDVAGPETVSAGEMVKRGYKLPFYADLTAFPEEERRVIWGMMVGQEGKTQVPVYGNYTKDGFDPARDALQCYGAGWTSASFLPQERQLFGLPGGFLNDWDLRTNIEGLYVAGDALFASDCYGHAAATGHYAGRHAAAYAAETPPAPHDAGQAAREKQRILAPLKNDPEASIGWKELNAAVAKTMRIYCGDVKRDALLYIGLEQLEEYARDVLPRTFAYNPHELTRLLEAFDILTVSELILHASLARRKSCPPLFFERGDEAGGEADEGFIAIRQQNGKVLKEELPMEFWGDMKSNYAGHNADYTGGYA
jgi:succinate dehydrogenase/fumarate reductase flavoprotein subunit